MDRSFADFAVFRIHNGSLQLGLPFDDGRCLEDIDKLFKDRLVVYRSQDLHEGCELLERHQLLPRADIDSG